MPVIGRFGGPSPMAVRVIEPSNVLRLAGALSCLLAAQLDWPGGWSQLRSLLMGAALLILPIDALPGVVVMTVRNSEMVLGPMHPGDIVAIVYLARLALRSEILDFRFSLSRMALVAFLVWSAFATALTGDGLVSSLGHIGLYAAVGVGVALRWRARAWLLAGVVGFALTEVVLYLPHAPARFSGVFVDDPSQMGALIIAALLVVAASALSSGLKIPLVGLLAFGILMTQTRSIWFAGVIVIIVAVLPRRWYIPLVVPPAIAALSFPFMTFVTDRFGLNPESGGLRLRSMSVGLHEFKEAPFAGHGWAFPSAVDKFGLAGHNEMPMYNLWIYLGVCVGLVGITIFVVYVAFLARAGVNDSVAYLFLAATLATSLSE